MTSKLTNDSELDRELRDMHSPAPPEGLAAKIKAEIPSAAELTAAAAAEPPSTSRIPWLKLAATVALAALAGTVAWRTLKGRDIEPVEPPPARAIEDVQRQSASALPPPPAAAAPKPTALPDEKLLAKEGVRSDLAANVAAAPPSPSFSRREVDAAAPAEPVTIVQAVTVPEIAPVAQARKDKSRDAEEAGAVGGVEGRVSGGVAGGIPGGVASGAAASPAPPASNPTTQEWLKRVQEGGRYSVAYDQVQGETAAGTSGARPNPSAAPAAPAPAGGIRIMNSNVEPPREQEQPDTMIFREAGVNRFVVTADDALSTFALDVDTGSYTLARSYIERGTLPPAAAIRLEEFVNAQKYSDRAPSGRNAEDFALYAEGGDSPYPDAAGLSLLRFAVKAREVDGERRKPANLTFVVDVSGSMNREDRLGLVKRALGLLLDELTPDDRVGLVIYGTNGRTLLHHTRDLRAIREAIARLVPEGSTNAEEGLKLAYDLADEGWTKGEINRIVLCSDGVANVGATGPESILQRIGDEARRGIQLTTVGFGMGNYNDELMERLADKGDGSYHYVDTLDEARKVFVENLTGTLQNVAKDAKIQVQFDAAAVERWRLLGYENRDVADRDFRNDAVDAGEVGAGQSATALYEVRLRPGVSPGAHIATLQVRWKSVDGKDVRELSRDLRAGDVRRSLDAGNRDLRVAAFAAAFAERLKGTRAGVELSWEELAGRTADLADDFPRDATVKALDELVDRAARLAGARIEPDDRDERGDRHRRRASEREREDGNGRLDEPE